MIGRFLGAGLAAMFVLMPPHVTAQEPVSEAAPAAVAESTSEVHAAERTLGPIPKKISTEKFAARPEFRDPVLSPDGTRFALLLNNVSRTEIALFDAASLKLIDRFWLSAEKEVRWLRWAGDNKLIISASITQRARSIELTFNRLVVRHLDDGATYGLKVPNRALVGDNIIHVANDGSHVLVSIGQSWWSPPSVIRYELEPDGESDVIVNKRNDIRNWYADNGGNVRLGTGWRRGRLLVYYRASNDDKFELIARLKSGDNRRYWDVLQVIEGSDQGYVLDENEDGRVGVRLFDYAKGEVIETFYENPDWDVDSLWLKEGKPLAALYTDDKEKVVWFDEKYENLDRKLRAALGQDVWVSSRSRNNERMLVWTGSEADPGALYIYTPADNSLVFFANFRPTIDHRELAKPKPVRFTARDGTKLTAFLTLPKGREQTDLPLIVLPHGGPYGIRDSLVYNDEVQFLANRGYAVLQPNFRGSGGYGEDFFELGTGQIGRGMQDDLDDAMDWAVEQGIADKHRVCVIGASYGGYAALWAVIRNPERYRCAASWAGVTDWDMMLNYDRRFFSRKGGKRWRERVEGKEDSFDLDDVSPYRLAATLTRPVLLAHGTKDDNVPFLQFEKMKKGAKDAAVVPETLVIEDEGHSFTSVKSEKQWYDALDAFLAEHNPAD